MGSIDHKIQRQAKGLVEVKCLVAGKLPLQLFVQTGEADLEHAVKLLFFGFDDLGHACRRINEFRIRALH